MSQTATPSDSPHPSASAGGPGPSRRARWAGYWLVMVVAAGLTVVVMLLLQNINQRKTEAQRVVFEIVKLTEDTVDPGEWGKNFPRQYDGYTRTVDVERTRYGGSENIQHLDTRPVWRTIFNGYAFSIDYREERGHAYMLADQRETERVLRRAQPGACLHCHASVLKAYRDKGVEAGIAPDEAHRGDAIMKGFEVVCAMPYGEATKLVEHPVACIDCHAPDTLQLRVTRPGFINGIRALARSDYPIPHFASIERWRKGSRAEPYDPNTMASRQEMRSMACAQCHVEYHFAGEGKLLTYPWHKGLKAEQIEAYYDEVGWNDWVHADSGAPVLKAQHPEFELWSQGIHARAGVSCADCHMPYKREGAIKVSDHHIRSPVLNIARACQTCHPASDSELIARVETIQSRTRGLMDRAESAVLDLIRSIQSARAAGASDEQLKAARALQRKAQWRLDFISAENSMGFHADQEAARLLGESMDYARQGQVEAVKVGGSATITPPTVPQGAAGKPPGQAPPPK
ncbi:MAG: ammonia-forming cytochrome c nitrite reductase subunit c552 [Phycisphaerales bacterium]